MIMKISIIYNYIYVWIPLPTFALWGKTQKKSSHKGAFIFRTD